MFIKPDPELELEIFNVFQINNIRNDIVLFCVFYSLI